MNILDLISKETGNIYKHKSSTHGGEFSGSCPWCFGDDRFSIHPERSHFVCRRCRKAGDAIEFVKLYLNKTYFEACAHLNIQPEINYNSLDVATEKKGQNEIKWQPREIKLPPAVWQDKATTFLFEAYKNLFSANGKKHRDYLNSRGLSNTTIKTARIGVVASVSTFSRESWGVVPEKKGGSHEGKIWIPKGIVIPDFKNDKVIRLRIRQDEPIGKDRYIIVSGSATGYFNYDKFLIETSNPDFPIEKPAFICEAELDGWLACQELGNDFSVFAIGNSSARPDIETHEAIVDKAKLLNLDNDKAGKEEVSWWQNKYDNVETHFTEDYKDIGECFENGIDVKKWGKIGLEKLSGLDIKKTLSSDTAKIESFKDAVYESQKLKDNKTIEKTPEIEINITKMPEKITEEPEYNTINPVCIHELYCQSLKSNVCLVNKKRIFNLDRCPKDYWWKHDSESGIITEIVLGIGLSKVG